MKFSIAKMAPQSSFILRLTPTMQSTEVIRWLPFPLVYPAECLAPLQSDCACHILYALCGILHLRLLPIDSRCTWDRHFYSATCNRGIHTRTLPMGNSPSILPPWPGHCGHRCCLRQDEERPLCQDKLWSSWMPSGCPPWGGSEVFWAANLQSSCDFTACCGHIIWPRVRFWTDGLPQICIQVCHRWFGIRIMRDLLPAIPAWTWLFLLYTCSDSMPKGHVRQVRLSPGAS